jgi:hypothetical protein
LEEEEDPSTPYSIHSKPQKEKGRGGLRIRQEYAERRRQEYAERKSEIIQVRVLAVA